MAPAFVVRVAAIANGDIKIAIRPEGEATRVVVEPRLVDLQQHALRRGIDARWISFGDFELGHVQCAVPV